MEKVKISHQMATLIIITGMCNFFLQKTAALMQSLALKSELVNKDVIFF